MIFGALLFCPRSGQLYFSQQAKEGFGLHGAGERHEGC